MTDPSAWPTPEQVLAALDQSGHLLEQQVATELADLGYSVQTNRAFTDVDEGKSRELDVYAFKSLMVEEARRLRVAMYLLVECKNTAAPFAFLTRPVPRRLRPPEEVLITLHSQEEHYQEGGTTYVRRTPTFDALGLAPKYWGTADSVKAVHISRLDRKGGQWNASNTGVFDSLTWPLAKAVRAFKAPFRNPNRGFNAGTDWSYVLFFPDRSCRVEDLRRRWDSARSDGQRGSPRPIPTRVQGEGFRGRVCDRLRSQRLACDLRQ